MRRLVVGVVLWAACGGESGGNASDGPQRPPESTEVPAIFDGSNPMDMPALRLLAARHELPTTETAAAHQAALDESEATLRAGGSAAADRIAAVCRARGVTSAVEIMDCHHLLGMVSSPASIALLAERAMTPLPEVDPQAHVHEPPAERYARGTAIDALERRCAEDDEAAAVALVELVRGGDELTRTLASRAVLQAMPRRAATEALREALPEDEHWRLYEVRP